MLHFGLNERGLINIFAKDIADLPEHVKKLWAGFNVTPDGNVSSELLASQMHVSPAPSVAPEIEFEAAMEELERVSIAKYGTCMLRPHAERDKILAQVHRFICLEEGGLARLCKDITRLTTDRLDTDLLQSVAPKARDKKGSLKCLEALISDTGADGHALLGPLHGAYNLRLADAHPPASDLTAARELLLFASTDLPLSCGKRAIRAVAKTLRAVSTVLNAP